MNLTDRQKYKDIQLHELASHGFDLVQLKYDGHWARVEIEGRRYSVYSRTGQRRTEGTLPHTLPKSTFVGEYIFGTNWAQGHKEQGKIVLFDCLRYHIDEVYKLPYEKRFQMVRFLITQRLLSSDFTTLQSWDISGASYLWGQFVETNLYEGLVFRRSKDTYFQGIVGRCKREVTQDYFVMEVKEGKGRHAGRMGALECGLMVGGVKKKVCTVGGGFSDEERSRIWSLKDVYIGKVLTAKGNCLFSSGALRSPNFVAWRDDKTPEECVHEV